MVHWLDEHLDVAKYAEEEGSNGLLYRSGAGDGVFKFAVAVNTSLTTIFGAAKGGAQLLVVHHPPWPDNELHLRDEKLAALEAAGVSLYAAHASLDCLPEVGNAWVLAGRLGVRVESTFGDFFGGHAGVIGQTDGEFSDFVLRASRALGVEVEAHQHAGALGQVAVAPGGAGASELMDEARQRGVTTYLTGEGKMFTRLFAKENGMNLIFGTHYATEAPGIRALGDRLAEAAQIPFEYIDESPDVF